VKSEIGPRCRIAHATLELECEACGDYDDGCSMVSPLLWVPAWRPSIVGTFPAPKAVPSCPIPVTTEAVIGGRRRARRLATFTVAWKHY